MQRNSQVAERVAEFQSSVSRHFRFLTMDHDFAQHDPKVRDITSPKDASVSVTFDRPDLRLTIGLGLFHDPKNG